MTVRSKILSYLKRCKSPKTPAQIARGTGCNRNTVRREVCALFLEPHSPVWRAGAFGYYIP